MRYVDSALDEVGADGLAAWLDQELTTASVLTIRSGFYSWPAVALLRGRLERLLADNGQVLMVLGGDPLQHDPGALRSLWELQQTFPATTRVFLAAGPAFLNAKTYHVQHRDQRATAWVGSANLTLGGLAVNVEAAVLLDSDHDDPALLAQVQAATRVAASRPLARRLDRAVLVGVDEARFADPGADGRASSMRPQPVVADHGRAVLERLVDRDVDRVDPGVVSTGLAALDRALDGGLRPGTVTVLASRRHAGATTLALNIAMRVAAGADRPVSLHAFGVTDREIVERALSATVMIERDLLVMSRLTARQRWSISEGLRRLTDVPLYVDTRSSPMVGPLSSVIRRTARRAGLDLVVIDPVTALWSGWLAYPEADDRGAVMRMLKDLAMDLQLPLLVTAELGGLAFGDSLAAQLAEIDARQDLSQTTDTIVLVHRPATELHRRARPGDIQLHVTKNRRGRRGPVTLWHRLDVGRFDDVPR